MKLTRRAVLAGAASLTAAPAFAAGAPNIVFITVDDLPSVLHMRNRFGVRVRSPSVNALMADGVTFTNGFASTALCNPSRTAIVSGMNPYRTGVHDNRTHWWERVEPRITFPGLLQKRGYRVSMFGKITHGGYAAWESSGVAQVVVQGGEGREGPTVNGALTAIKQTGPWLVMMGFRNPHELLATPERFYEDYPLSAIEPLDWSGDALPPHIAKSRRDAFADLEAAGQVDDFIQNFLANIAEFDFYLGQLLDGIRALPRRPIVILTSDHGFHLGEHDAVSKFTLWDTAARAPLVVSAPGTLSGVEHDSVVSLLDIAPTVLDLVGEDIPARFDGRSLRPLLYDASLNRVDGALTTMGDSVSLRTNRHRITRYDTGEVELFDYADDPGETNNLADERPAFRDSMLKRLDARLAQWKATRRWS
jgi:arylsulfatase A-like enzyme